MDLAVPPQSVLPKLSVSIGIQKPVQMNDEIPHMGIVHRLLCLGLPRGMGLRVIGKDTHYIQIFQIPEMYICRIIQFSAKYQMQQLFF